MIYRRMIPLALVATIAIEAPGHAASPVRPPDRPRKVELRMRRTLDIAITLLGAGVWIGTESAKKQIVGSAGCSWCDRDSAGNDSLNSFDSLMRQLLKWHDTSLADGISNAVGFAVVPALAFGMEAIAAVHDDRRDEWLDDALIIAETTALSVDLNQLVKFTVRRERPFVHVLDPADKPHTANPADNNLSFYSGHTTFTTTLAFAAGTVASLRHYRWAGWVYTAGIIGAAATGYLRIAADKHYAIDVLTGALLGAAFGEGVPRLLHGAKTHGAIVMALPTNGGGMVSALWRF
jgi:membrane-associated phospholipid phosphatase